MRGVKGCGMSSLYGITPFPAMWSAWAGVAVAQGEGVPFWSLKQFWADTAGVSGEYESTVDRVAPLAWLSPGWPFLIAGLAVVAAVMLVPAWRDVQDVRLERGRLQAVVDYEGRRVEATHSMLAALHAGDPELQRRLIAWQLNLLPAGDVAIAREVHAGGVLGWIDDTVEGVTAPPLAPAVSRLESIVSGPARLWMMAAGVLLVFVGLVGFGSVGSSRVQLKGPMDPR